MTNAVPESTLREAFDILADGGYFKSCIETYTDCGKKFKTRLYNKEGKKDKRFRFNAFKRLYPFLVAHNGEKGRTYRLLQYAR